MFPDTLDLLESLPSHAAVLDAAGSVVAANTAYRNLIHDLDPDAGLDDSFLAHPAEASF
jgi:Amt family ammonium transporter